MLRQEGLNFTLQGSLKHLPGSLANIGVQGTPALVGDRPAQWLAPQSESRGRPQFWKDRKPRAAYLSDWMTLLKPSLVALVIR